MVRAETSASRRRLYLLARVIVTRHYRQDLTLEILARALASSPRQIQRAYAQFGDTSFREDLRRRRLRAAAELLAGQPSIPVADVARLVGYRQAPHLARAFRERYGHSPARFRELAVRGAAQVQRSAPATAVPVTTVSSRTSPSPESSRPAGSGSRPGSRSRISVPPSGAGSAVTAPPC